MFGTTLSTAPFAKGLYVSSFSDYDTKQTVRGRVKQMQRLETINNKIKKGLQWYGESSLGTVEDIEANEKKITKVYFDRGIYKYHGRVKIFAETLRKNGMEF